MKFDPNYKNDPGGPEHMSWDEFEDLWELTESELAEIAKDDDPAIELKDCNPEQRRIKFAGYFLQARIKTGIRKT